MNDIQATIQQMLHSNLYEILLAVPFVFLTLAVYGTLRPAVRKMRRSR